jgi:pyruvate/2-oxoglutarate dehydrogenase complex dihydrolipoamide dehydrogenase (E3) component
MPVDYDLVVIGGSAAGIQAAIAATQLKARVVLVDQGCATGMISDAQVLSAVGQTFNQLQRGSQLGLRTTEAAFPSAATVWTQAKHWSVAAAASAEMSSPAVLSAMGIEVIAGSGEFHRKPKLGLLVNGRSLRSRAYLLAIDALPVSLQTEPTGVETLLSPLAEISGLATVGYLTADVVLQKLPALASRQLVIIGGDAIGVELAQSLVRLGRSVMLIVPDAQLLPHEDAEAAFLLQAQLEAEGVEVLTGTSVPQVREIDGKKWVQAGNRAIETDEIILAMTPPFDPTSLNLAAASVKQSLSGILVNAKLQTTNPRIYACRGRIAGYDTPHSAIADANVALKNALFLPIAKVSDHHAPNIVATHPPLARVGQTETAALQRYGNDVIILRQSFKTLTKAQLQDETTGFCKLLVHRNGELLGAHIVGLQAEELISTIALAMQQKLKIQAIASLVLPSSSLAAILQQTAAEWQRLRLQKNTRLQDFLEGFFNWRRSVS